MRIRNATRFAAAMLVAAPAAALADEPIGSIEAGIDGEQGTWRTLYVPADDTASAEFRDIGDATSITIQGHPQDGPLMEDVLGFEATVANDGADAEVMDATVSQFPDGMGSPFYVSDGSGVEPSITWTQLDLVDGGMAEGTFSATMCRRDDMMEEPDLDDCREVEGSFATELRAGD